MAESKKTATPEPKNNDITKIMNRLDDAEKKLGEYQNKLEESSKKVVALQDENAKLQNSLKKTGWEKFVDELIAQDKILPAENKDRIVSTLMVLDSTNPEECAKYTEELKAREGNGILQQNFANRKFEEPELDPTNDFHKKITDLMAKENVDYVTAYQRLARS